MGLFQPAEGAWMVRLLLCGAVAVALAVAPDDARPWMRTPEGGVIGGGERA